MTTASPDESRSLTDEALTEVRARVDRDVILDPSICSGGLGPELMQARTDRAALLAEADRLRAENAALAARIETALAHIRKCIHIGLQDAKLYDEPGEKRIGEWADFIDGQIRAALGGDQDGGGER